jgi:hypothetical protein
VIFTGVNGNNNVPSKYSLSQNYPNPFNPVTSIEFEIPEKTFVSLKITDITGKEVDNLLNEYKEPGKYNVSFDANRFSSGVYFYTIRTANYYNSRKMVLIK